MANVNRNQDNPTTPPDQRDKNQDRRDPNTGTPGDRNLQGDRSSQGGSQRDQGSPKPGQPDQRSKKPGDMNEDDEV